MRVIRRHFLAASVDPAASLSVDHVDHAALRALGWWTTARPRKGTTRSQEDAAVDAHVERSTMVHWFSCAAIAAE